jgi:hypothetical protein
MKRSALVLLAGLLAGPTSAETISFKCSLSDGKMDAQVLYVINSATNDVSVIGDFGTHSAKLLNYAGDFYFVLEPNIGASVSTVIYSKAGETPVAVRTTLGMLPADKYKDIPDDYKLAGDALKFMAISLKGRCPVQR